MMRSDCSKDWAGGLTYPEGFAITLTKALNEIKPELQLQPKSIAVSTGNSDNGPDVPLLHPSHPASRKCRIDIGARVWC